MTEVGVHKFRNKICEYVRRAEASEIIAITRRGKLIAVLSSDIESQPSQGEPAS
jgi:prevent-host-death family protein